jgi:hypothetical protein
MRILLLILSALILVTGFVSAQDQESPIDSVYYSSNGKFVIRYPASWGQVDYATVDYFLMRSDANQQALEYEAVFAPKESGVFYNGPYLILTVDTVGQLNQEEIDSLLDQLSQSFGEGIKYLPTGDYLTDLATQAPNWDAAKRQISIRTNITEQYKVIKRNLWVMQLYDGGIANFYFFTPDTLFEQYRPTFEEIVRSFQTENIEELVPKQQHKLAKIEDMPEPKNRNSLTLFGIPTGLIVILIIIIASRKKRRMKDKVS